jgi:hypothetical protein
MRDIIRDGRGIDGEALGKNLAPFGFTEIRATAVDETDDMAALAKGVRGHEHVRLRSAEGADPFVNKK